MRAHRDVLAACLSGRAAVSGRLGASRVRGGTLQHLPLNAPAEAHVVIPTRAIVVMSEGPFAAVHFAESPNVWGSGWG
jgi:hypothetical protein